MKTFSFYKLLLRASGVIVLSAMLVSCGVAKSGGGLTPSELSEKLKIDVKKKDDLKMYRAAAKWLGVPYKYGGTTMSGVDCSALVINIMKESHNLKLSRSAESLYKDDCHKISKNNLKPGDLIFFHMGDKKGSKRTIDHVALHLKDGVFIHATTKRGVMINKVTDSYYEQRIYLCGRIDKL